MLESLNTIYDILISRPLVMLILFGLPLLLIARWRHIFPSRLLLLCSTIPAALSLMMLLFPIVGWYVLAVDGILLLIAGFDLLTVIPQHRFTATRKLLHVASLGKPQSVEIEMTGKSRRGCRAELKDDLPQTFEAKPIQVELKIPPRSRTLFSYQFTPHQRGQNRLRCVHLLVSSLFGLWRGFYKIPCESVVQVYPDMKQIAEFDLLARTNRLSLLGMRRSRKIGQDNEFERLRDYTQDDNYKFIDWRSTAKRRKLTVRDFQTSQSQRIIFLVDCGRMMTGQSQDVSFLDHSLNAMLMLSYVALRQGDSVGMISFSNTIHNFTPVRAGVQHINRLLHASFDLDARYVESRYDEAFLYLRKHCRKRSLVVLLTNVIDEINANQIRQYLSAQSGKHLPLGVLLRDHEIFSAVEDVDFAHNESVYQAAAAVDVLTWRQQVITDLQHSGVLALDVFPEKLTSSLVNQYLEIKARHLL